MVCSKSSLFLFNPSIDSLKVCPFSWLGSSYLVRDALHRLRREDFSVGYISQTECFHKIQIRREVPFKLIFI